jgi:hypothetical protein
VTERQRARTVALRRALIASAAVFATVFTLLAAQLWLGNDPALGRDGGQPAAQEQELHASVLDTVLGVATSLLDEEHGDEDEQGPAVRSGTS